MTTKINVKDLNLGGSQAQQNKFCELWPMAKAGLTALLAILKEPLKSIVKTVISIGDAVAKNICG